MFIYIICPVRLVNGEAVPEVAEYVAQLEAEGHRVHYPPRDVDQSDPIGNEIVEAHYNAMTLADRCDIFWNSDSTGSHFDLAMAYCLGVPVKLVKAYNEDVEGKSYLKVIKVMEEEDD
jgi:hypothetical protein